MENELTKSSNLLSLYNNRLLDVIENHEGCIRLIIIDRIKELTYFFNDSMSCSTHKVEGLRFEKSDYINLKLQNTPTSPQIDFLCKGIGEIKNAKGCYVMYGKLKNESTNTVEIIEKLPLEYLNKLFETCIKYIKK